MRVLVTGASGLLGLNLCMMQTSSHHIIGVTNRTVLSGLPFQTISADLTDEDVINKIIEDSKPDLLINCAALAVVDQCESKPLEADRTNSWLPGQLAEICSKRDIPLIHISTDAVFDGVTGGYSEFDQPNPLSIYASTKLKGERLVQQTNPQAVIARVNFYGYSVTGKRSLAEFFLNNLLAGKTVNGFSDVLFSPLYVKNLVDILFEMHDKELFGLYHVVCSEKISKYKFGLAIAERFGLDCGVISPISYLDSNLTAKRSLNLFLDNSKLLSTGVAVHYLEQGINQFYNDYQSNWHERIHSFLQ